MSRSPYVRPRVWPMFAGLLIALTLLLGTVMLVHFSVDYRTQSTVRDTNETLNVELARRALAADISAVTTDLMFLGRLLESLSFEPSSAPALHRFLAQVFVTFSDEKRLYDQVRFIGPDGQEIVRVDRSDGQASVIAKEALQDKSDRYYVSQGNQLQRGQVYLSRFDLNIEAGVVQQPLKPMLRFATPVFDANGERRGLVVLNYLGERLLERFRQATANIADHVQLLNAEAYWLSSPRPAEAWGFMFGRDETFARRNPTAWREINTRNSGRVTTSNGLFTFSTLRPAVEAAGTLEPGRVPTKFGDVWKVVAHLRLDAGSLGLGHFIRLNAPLYLGLGLLLSVLAYLLASAIVHRRTAEAHRSYEERFRRTLEDIGLAALMIDTRGRLTFVNHYLLELSGWLREEVLGEDWVDRFVPTEQRDTVRQVLKRLRDGGDYPHVFEGEVCTASGERRLIAWNNTLARDSEGRVIGLTAIGEDVTERRLAEDQVRKLSQAVEQSPTIVLITDCEGRIEYANRKFTEVTGYAFSEVSGRNPRFLKSGETRAEEYQRLWSALSVGGEWRGEFHNRRKDGSLYWESAVISALRDSTGKVTHFLALKEDITERKRLRKEVDARNQELARAQALAAMGQMSTMLAHDLRNPLSSVKMAVQILGKQAQSDEARELATIGQEQVHYMEDIITDMLTYSRPGALKSQWLSADKLIASVIGTVRRRIIEYGVEVSTICEPGLPTFPGDESKLRQLLSNLLVNAFQAAAMRPAGERYVSVEAALVMQSEGRRLQFRVCDNGEGLDPKTREQLFEPFFTTRTKGTGLGLAIVRQLAELHGGVASLIAASNGGTCAMLTLPLTPVDGLPSSADDEPVVEKESQ